MILIIQAIYAIIKIKKNNLLLREYYYKEKTLNKFNINPKLIKEILFIFKNFFDLNRKKSLKKEFLQR